jgi:nitroreductase
VLPRAPTRGTRCDELTRLRTRRRGRPAGDPIPGRGRECFADIREPGRRGCCNEAVTTPLSLSPDELLTTTRAVRRRLDLDRPVGLEVIRACLQVALQAPSGSNTQGWHWVVVTDVDQRARIAELYRSAFAEYRNSATHPGGLFEVRSGRAAEQERVSRSVAYLAENLHRVPVLLIACVRAPGSAVLSDQDQVSMWGSLLPAVWSYMLAARARGLGTAWTDLHLHHRQEVAAVLNLPDDIRQGPLIPTAYSIGTDFKPAARAPLEDVLHIDRW